MHLFCIKPFLFDGPLWSADKSSLLSSWMLDRCWLSGWDSMIDIIYRQGILCVYRGAIWILPTAFYCRRMCPEPKGGGNCLFSEGSGGEGGRWCITSQPPLKGPDLTMLLKIEFTFSPFWSKYKLAGSFTCLFMAEANTLAFRSCGCREAII